MVWIAVPHGCHPLIKLKQSPLRLVYICSIMERTIMQGETVEQGGLRRYRLVLIPAPLQGHMTPMLQLGTYLHSKGFSITIAHSEFNPPDPSNYPADFIFVPLPDNSGDFLGTSKFWPIANNNCKPHLQQHLIQIKSKQSEKESIVIVYDCLMFCAGSVAGILGIPCIMLHTSSAAFVSAVTTIPQLQQEGRFPVQDSLLQEIVPELHPFRYKEIQKIPVEINNMITINSPPSAYIFNTLEFFEPLRLTQLRKKFQIPIFSAGPLNKIISTPSTSLLVEDTGCILWLDKQAPKSVMYVSFGSMENMEHKVLTEMAWGLANSKQPFLWVVRPGLVTGFECIDQCLPKALVIELKGRGLIVEWAPQKQVLAHFAVGGFWTHCGWNSTLESISEGVPVLCQPFSLDQVLNARYLSYVWKMGVDIVLERGEIEEAIKRVLMDKEMRQRAMEIREKLMLAISPGGSSENSLNDLVNFILSL